MKLWLFFIAVLVSPFFQTGAHGVLASSGIVSLTVENGFKVFQKAGDNWERVGFMAFNSSFSEQTIQVGVKGEPLTLRFEKKGSGPGHVDFAQIANLTPHFVDGVNDDTPIIKLSAKDFDVVHITEEGGYLQLGFKSGGELHLAARVEKEKVSDIPFRFPLSNLYTQITNESDFYRIHPDSSPKVIFSEETSPRTGHPLGVTTASTMVKNNKLYVRLDFESDNTLDGGKDYASLHLRTSSEVRTFTINQNDLRWGKAHFSYTPAVPWQHKIYDFIIPMDEIGEIKENRQIEVAMSAYGTASAGGDFSPSLAYGSNNSEYMAAYYYSDGPSTQVRTQRYDREGIPVGSYLPVTIKDNSGRTEEDIAYDPVHDQFLVAWIENPNPGISNVHTQIISSSNSLVDDVGIPVASDDQRYPALAFRNSAADQRYLIAWQENSVGGHTDIKGNITTWDNQVGSNFDISTEVNSQSRPRIAYNSTGDIFTVVWEDQRNGITSSDIYARIIQSNGTPDGASTSVSTAPGSQLMPDIANDPNSNHSLVVWQDDRNSGATGYDIYGQILVSGTMRLGDEFIVTKAAGDQWQPRVAYADKGDFLVTWEDRGPDPTQIRGRFYSSLGEPIGSEKVFTRINDVGVQSPVLAASDGKSFLIAYNYIDVPTASFKIGTKFVSGSTGRIFMFIPAIVSATGEKK